MDGGEDGRREGHAATEPRQAPARGRSFMATAAVLFLVSLGLVAVGVSSLQGQRSVMPQYQYTTTTTVGCGCCGAVGCYCTGQCGAVAGPGMLYGGPPLGTQAAVTPDWTDVVTSLTREVSEDTAEIAGLKATVLRQLLLKSVSIVSLFRQDSRALTFKNKYLYCEFTQERELGVDFEECV
jgi:hypothetical protein